MPVLFLTGPSGAGKNNVAVATAKLLDHCAVIDVDVVRLMVVESETLPNAALVDLVRRGDYASVAPDHYHGDEWQPGVRAVCALGHQFVSDGYGLIVADILSAESMRTYRESFRSAKIVVAQLLPSRDEIQQHYDARVEAEGRDRIGDPAIVNLLYDQQAAFDDYDLRIDNSERAAADVAKELAALLG